MDTVQLILLVVVIILAILLLVLGVQIFFILREFKQTIIKANKVLDDTGMITESVTGPIASLSGIAGGLKTGALLAGFLKGKKAVKKVIEEDGE